VPRKAQFACQDENLIDFPDDRYIADNCYRLDGFSFTGKPGGRKLPRKKTGTVG
jgi:hypothetical protein